MRKTVKYLGMIALMILGSLETQAQTIFAMDFSKAEGYVDGPLAGQPAGTSQQWVDANPTAIADEFNIENEALSIISNFTSGNWVTIPIPLQKGVFTFEFDCTYTGDGTRLNVGINVSDSGNFNIDNNPLPTFNEQGAMVRLANDNFFDARNGDGAGGGTFSKLEDVLYNTGETIHVREVINVPDESVSVWVKPASEPEEIQIADTYVFRRFTSLENEGLNTIAIFENGSDGSVAGVGVILDNFKVYGPDGFTSVSDWALF